MNAAAIKLTDSDYSTLFKNDPETFFEALIINLFWQDTEVPKINSEIVNKQKLIFLKWLRLYRTSEVEKLMNGTVKEMTKGAAEMAYEVAYKQGRLETLINLPTKGKFTKKIDIAEVNKLIKELTDNEQS